MEISQQIKALAIAKHNADLVAAKLKEMLAAVKATDEYKSFEAAQKKYAEDAALLTDEVQKRALSLFDTTKEKKPGGLPWEIKEFDVVVYDQAQAIEWCQKNMPMALSLKLDVEVFEQVALSGKIPASVATVKKEPRVYMKKDLSAWME